jgi:non-specific serine/threonine protein kinase
MVQLLTAETLKVDRALQSAPPQVIQQGRNDLSGGRVHLTSTTFTEARATVTMPNATYTVIVRLFNGDVSQICSCSQGHQWTMCRHRVATLLALQEHLTANPPSLWKAVLQRGQAAPARRSSSALARVVFSLQNQGHSWWLQAYTIAGKHFPTAPPEDPFDLATFIAENGLYEAARPLHSRISRSTYPQATPEAVIVANLIQSSSSFGYASSYAHDYGYNTYNPHSSNLETLLTLLPRCPVFLGESGEPLVKPLLVLEEPADLELHVSQAERGLRLQPSLRAPELEEQVSLDDAQVICRSPLWLLLDDLVVQVNDPSGVGLTMLDYPQIEVPKAEIPEFLTDYLMPMAEQVPVGGNALTWEEVTAEPVPRLYLSEEQGQLLAQLRFGYGQHELAYVKRTPPSSMLNKPGTLELVRVARDAEREQAAWQALSGFGLKRGEQPDLFALRKNTHPVDFLLHQVPRLVEHGFEIYGEQELTSARVNRNRPTLSFSVKTGIDWFDVQAVVNYGELSVSLKEVRRALRKRERFIKLADGSIGALPQEWVDRYRRLFALGEETDGGLRLSSRHLTLLDQLLEEAERAQTDPEFERRRQHLRDFSQIEQRPPPAGFRGDLRHYQQSGYDWLHFLHEYQFGGCLADDMGTGKTIQTLAFLQSLREGEPQRRASLIVMPRSLLFNWEREAARFTPDLQTYIHADQGRISDPESFGAYDLVLTTYGVMLRDIDLLRQYRFHYAILDESQAIKNPVSETARAARQLNSDHRLVLTGTPVENSTSELWSQFAFLNPGMLGSLDYFREEFVTPIERKQDQETARFLSRMVYPFILRRTKEQVALELPELSERLLESDMEPAQRTFYNKQRDYYRSLLLGLIEDEGMNDARLKVLEGLLRLRQICNHPRLVDAAYRGGSAKFEQLLETLDTLQAEGHKALVFSQFVQMLALVREALEQRGVRYCYLDGSTQHRERVVDAFQQDPRIPFFLISLKAGGVGLNLTAADYVIHIDPWWNPAVEMQATDRAHRIGQDKPVFVYKLVTRESVEEKILQLQERKRALVEQIIAPESSFLKSLTRDDVEVLFS